MSFMFVTTFKCMTDEQYHKQVGNVDCTLQIILVISLLAGAFILKILPRSGKESISHESDSDKAQLGQVGVGSGSK